MKIVDWIIYNRTRVASSHPTPMDIEDPFFVLEAYTEEEIEAAYGKWCEYWRDYWKKRGTKAAYPKDYVCEASIPVSEG